MNPLVANLFNELKCGVFEDQQRAVLKIAILLEKISFTGVDHVEQQDILGDELYNLEISSGDKAEVIMELHRNLFLATDERNRASILWALGRAVDLNSFTVLLDYLAWPEMKLDSDAVYQLLTSIENHLQPNVYQDIGQQMGALTRSYFASARLKNIIDQHVTDADEVCQRLLKKINDLEGSS